MSASVRDLEDGTAFGRSTVSWCSTVAKGPCIWLTSPESISGIEGRVRPDDSAAGRMPSTMSNCFRSLLRHTRTKTWSPGFLSAR